MIHLLIRYIWRESITQNDYKCNICGSALADNSGKPLDGRTIENKDFLQCRLCRNVVAFIGKEFSSDD